MLRIIVFSALAALAVAAFSAAGSAASPQALSTPCGKVSGPTVNWNGQKLNRYIVGAFHGTTCSFARTWVSKIVRESTPNGSISHPKGPAGWECIARAKSNIAFNGSCRAGLKSFSWGAI